MSRTTMPSIGLAARVAVLVILAGMVGSLSAKAGNNSEVPPHIEIGGPFELTDQHGAVRRDTDFRGRYMLVYFGYNWCPDVCPTSLYNMSVALDKLGPTAAFVQPIYITVDPERDTVEAMKDYAEHFHPSLVALTGRKAEIYAAARAYRVYFEKTGDVEGQDYFMDHTAFIYLMDTSGKFLRYFSHEAMAEEIATGIKELL